MLTKPFLDVCKLILPVLVLASIHNLVVGRRKSVPHVGQQQQQDSSGGPQLTSGPHRLILLYIIVVPYNMNTKMKGLFKGLRYISQIFDSKEEEEEMQIGHPTDVKHVAHIGWDSPSLNSPTGPTWMNDFRSASLGETVTGTERAKDQPPPKDLHSDSSAAREESEQPPPQRQSRRNASFDTPGGDPSSGGSRHSRRHQSAGHVSMGSAGGDPSEGSRHHRRSKASSSATGCDSPAADLPAIPRQSRRKKTKGSTTGSGSSRSSRIKDANTSWSDPGADGDPTADRLPALPSIKTAREGEVF